MSGSGLRPLRWQASSHSGSAEEPKYVSHHKLCGSGDAAPRLACEGDPIDLLTNQLVAFHQYLSPLAP